MPSEFITRVEHEKEEPYTVIFKTDDADKYKQIEDECRKMIGHAKPTVDAVPVSYIYKRARELKNDDMIYAYTVLNSLIANYRADGERRTE